MQIEIYERAMLGGRATTPSRMMLFWQGLVLALTLCIISRSMGAEIGTRCLEATYLWMPQETTSEKPTKWNSEAVGYDIVADERNANIISSIEESLQFQSKGSGLKFSKGTGFGVDLLIAVVPDISAFASLRARNSVVNYFQDYYRKSNIQGTFEIDAASWDATFREIVPKCVGSDLMYQRTIERAFLAVQQDQSLPCINIGLGEILGLRNIRKYYVAHHDVPPDLITLGLQTLYDRRIVAGMSRSDASNKLKEVCDVR